MYSCVLPPIENARHVTCMMAICKIFFRRFMKSGPIGRKVNDLMPTTSQCNAVPANRTSKSKTGQTKHA